MFLDVKLLANDVFEIIKESNEDELYIDNDDLL